MTIIVCMIAIRAESRVGLSENYRSSIPIEQEPESYSP